MQPRWQDRAGIVLGFTAVTGAAWTCWILGILIGADAIWALMEERRGASGAA